MLFEKPSICPCWILSHPRSGSLLLCNLLNNTNLFRPKFQEWFAIDTTHPQGYWPALQNIPCEDRYSRVMQEEFPPYCKIHKWQYDQFFTNRQKPKIEQKLPGIKYIQLKRRDHIACAVSMYLAHITGICHSDNLTHYQMIVPEVPIDDKMLLKCYEIAINYYSHWDEYLGNSKVLVIHYEEFCQNPASTLVDVINYLDIPCNVVALAENSVKQNKLVKLANKQTEELKDRLRILISTSSDMLDA